MRSSFDILSGIYQVIRPVVVPTITGGCYLNEEPKDMKENVSINLLANPIAYLQQAIVNVNIHVRGLSENQANLARMKEIVDLIIPLLDDNEYLISGVTLHLSIDDDKGVYKDVDNTGKYYYNLRVNCITI